MKLSTIALTLLVLLFSAGCSSPTPPPATSAAPSATAPAATASATAAPPTAGPGLTQPAPVPTASPPTATLAASATVTPTATADAAIAGGLVGLWQGNNNSFYLFNKDGTWSWDQNGDKVLTQPENKGRWWVEGDVVHLQDLSGRAPCPLNQIGAYQAQLTGDTLELAAVADPCTVRIGQTSGTYARQPAGP